MGALLVLTAFAGEEDATGTGVSMAEPAEAGAAPGALGLQAYVGHYPFQEVNGVAWHDHPAVLAGIRASIRDEAVRKAVLELPGPSDPIAVIGGRISASTCELHNCGDHHWVVMVDPASGATDVCYHNARQTVGQSRWFLATGSEEMRPGACPLQ